MKRLRVLLVLALIASGLFVPSYANTDNQPRRVLSGWIPYYSVKSVLPFVKKIPALPAPASDAPITCEDNEFSLEDLALINNSYLYRNKDLMKEVMPFWYTLKSPTVIRDDYVTGNPSWPMADALCLMRKSGVSIIPSITDGTNKLVLSKYLADPKVRAEIVKTIVDLVNRKNFDGIDLDFEGFAFVDGSATWPSTAPNWILFIKELASVLHENKKILSVTTPVHFNPLEKSKGYTVYSWAEIASSIDRLRIMTYDYSVAKPGPIGPIFWADKTIRYAISVMPASKVFIGLPGYGRDWITSITGTCPTSAPPSVSSSAKAATFKMNYASAKAAIDGATPIFDEKSSEATYSYVKTFNGETVKGAATTCNVARTVWFQNSRSFAERTALVGKYRLGGVVLWTMGMEDPSATSEIRRVAVAIAPDQVISTAMADRSEVLFGEEIFFSGALFLQDKTPLKSLSILVEARKLTSLEWNKIAEILTDDNGAFSTSILLGTSTLLRARSEGTWERLDSMSSELSVSIKPWLSLRAPTTIKIGGSKTISGKLYPNEAGRLVQVQRLISGKWRSDGFTSVTNDDGSFTVNVLELKRGIVTLRVLVAQTLTSPEVIAPQFSLLVR